MATNTTQPVSRANTGLRDAGAKIPQSPTATSTILPGPNPGERLALYFDKLFATIIGISTLGASITFSKIIQTPVQPWIDYGFDPIEAQTFMAIAWLLFVIALILTSLFASLLSLYRPQCIEAFATVNHRNKQRTMWAATGVSLLLISLIFASFIFLSLVTATYLGAVGWVALGFTAIFGLIGMGGIIWQSPLDWPNWVLKLLPRSGKDEPLALQPRRQTGLGLDAQSQSASWPLYGKGAPRPSILPQTASNTRPGGQGANLTGGALFSSLRHKPSYTDLHHNMEPALKHAGMEESFSTEKEWETLRVAGAHASRFQPRVSWPKEGVVSDQFSPKLLSAQPHRQHAPPTATRRGHREYKHDRRERMQMQQNQQSQSQTQTDETQEQHPTEQRFSSYSSHRTSMPPQYQEQDDSNYEPELDEQSNPMTGYAAVQDFDNDEPLSEISSLSHPAQEEEQYHPQLHHHNQQVHRTVPPTRRSGAHRPVWEMEGVEQDIERRHQQEEESQQQRRGAASRYVQPEEDTLWTSANLNAAYGL